MGAAPGILIKISAEQARTALIETLENLPAEPGLQGLIDRVRTVPAERLGIICRIDNFVFNQSSLEVTWNRHGWAPDRLGIFEKRPDGRWAAKFTGYGPIP